MQKEYIIFLCRIALKFKQSNFSLVMRLFLIYFNIMEQATNNFEEHLRSS